MKIIFMGTSEFAVPIFKNLISSEHKIVALFTAPKKVQGRGMHLYKSSIYDIAAENNIVIHTPLTLKSYEVQNFIKNIDADIIVVVAYGLLIPKVIFDSKKYGAINVHPSLLPKFRGASPLQYTILSGEQVTGVSIIKIDEGIDSGPILLQEKFSIKKNIKFLELQDICSSIGSRLLLNLLKNINTFSSKEQNIDDDVSYTKKLNKSDGLLTWDKSAFELDCKIRALNPWPGAYFVHKNQNIKIIEASYNNDTHFHPSGIFLKDMFSITCKRGMLFPILLQRPGRKVVNVKDFFNGYNFKDFNLN